MRILVMMVGSVTLVGCIDQTSIQHTYVAQRDLCQAKAEVDITKYIHTDKQVKEEDRNAQLVTLFSECMFAQGWTVATPGRKDGKDVAGEGHNASDIDTVAKNKDHDAAHAKGQAKTAQQKNAGDGQKQSQQQQQRQQQQQPQEQQQQQPAAGVVQQPAQAQPKPMRRKPSPSVIYQRPAQPAPNPPAPVATQPTSATGPQGVQGAAIPAAPVNPQPQPPHYITVPEDAAPVSPVVESPVTPAEEQPRQIPSANPNAQQAE